MRKGFVKLPVLSLQPDICILLEAFFVNEKPNYKGRYLITGKWTDSDNNIWYKVHWVGDWREEGYTLHKISNSGETLESVTDTKYPSEIDPQNNLYRKYIRK